MTRSKQRFTVTEYKNPRTGSMSYRVYGIKRNGEIVRQNFADEDEANQLCQELNLEYLSKTGHSDLRKTSLSPDQLKFAEAAFLKLENPGDLVTAVDHWLRHGKPASVKESPRLNIAFEAFKQWIQTTNEIRDSTKKARLNEVGNFANFTGLVRVVDLDVDHVLKYLDASEASQDTKDSKRKVLSTFFRWCMDSKRRWCVQNPCLSLTIEGTSRLGEREPKVFSVETCEKLLRTAEKFNKGELIPYIALCLFGGIRPNETARLKWDQVNLADSELTIASWQAKTGRKRTLVLDEPLATWLRAYPAEGHIAPANYQKKMGELRAKAGIGEWIHDGLRHTAISHYFRKTGSYGLTAERHGNSEAIIKAHYQGKVNSEDTAKFYALLPMKKQGRKIVVMPGLKVA